MKDYGVVALNDKCAGGLLHELADVWDIKRLKYIEELCKAPGI